MDAARRSFLGRSGVSLGTAALGALLSRERVSAAAAATTPSPAADAVIFVCLAGGPSHLETFDHKPRLAALDGRPMPESFTAEIGRAHV